MTENYTLEKKGDEEFRRSVVGCHDTDYIRKADILSNYNQGDTMMRFHIEVSELDIDCEGSQWELHCARQSK
jgi:hypothetical protein